MLVFFFWLIDFAGDIVLCIARILVESEFRRWFSDVNSYMNTYLTGILSIRNDCYKTGYTCSQYVGEKLIKWYGFVISFCKKHICKYNGLVYINRNSVCMCLKEIKAIKKIMYYYLLNNRFWKHTSWTRTLKVNTCVLYYCITIIV